MPQSPRKKFKDRKIATNDVLNELSTRESQTNADIGRAV